MTTADRIDTMYPAKGAENDNYQMTRCVNPGCSSVVTRPGEYCVPCYHDDLMEYWKQLNGKMAVRC